MSVEEIKKEIASLSADDKKQVADFLSQFGQEEAADADLEAFLRRRLSQARAGDFSNQSVSEIWQEVRAAR
jgi:Antitoxin ParD